MTGPVATCVWRLRPEVVAALIGRFGEPVDSYANGGQTWLRADGPQGTAVEWRLHPAPGFRLPEGTTAPTVFGDVARALAADDPARAEPTDLWDGLEVYPAYGDPLAVADLAAAAEAALGLAPDAAGTVDHDRVADAWERSGGTASVTAMLLAELA